MWGKLDQNMMMMMMMVMMKDVYDGVAAGIMKDLYTRHHMGRSNKKTVLLTLSYR